MPAPGTPTAASAAVDGKYSIKSGDTFATIAKELYGESRYWTAIESANIGVDPKRLRVGQVINVPPKDRVVRGAMGGAGASGTAAPSRATRPGAAPGRPDTAAARPDAATGSARPAVTPAGATPAPATRPVAGSTYIVGDGDTLISIAREVLKDESRWREIYELNRDRLSSPDRLIEGSEIRLPTPMPTPTRPLQR